jgi:hypothetical protein
MPSPYSSQLPQDVALDGGLILLNSATPTLAVRGGLEVNTGTEWRNLEFDGKRSDIVGLDRKTGFAPTIRGTVINLFGSTFYTLFEPGGAAAGSAPAVLTPKAAGTLLSSGDYLINVCAAWPQGDGSFVGLFFPFALAMLESVRAQDKNEAEATLTIQARLGTAAAASSTDTAPYTWRFAASLASLIA